MWQTDREMERQSKGAREKEAEGRNKTELRGLCSQDGICHSAYCMLMTQGSFGCKQLLIYGQSVNSFGQRGREEREIAALQLQRGLHFFPQQGW